MNRCTAFVELAKIVGYDASRYSGRGMYGAECVSLRLPEHTNALHVMFRLGMAFPQLPEEMQRELADIYDYMKGATTDRVGYGSVLYFRTIKWQEPDEVGPDEDEPA